MKFTLRLLLLFFVIFQFPIDGHSQILKRTLGKLGERVVEKKVEKEIDKKIDEVADSIVRAMDKEDPMTAEERAEADENRRKAGKLLSGMMGGINQVDLPDAFQFSLKIDMEMEDDKGRITNMTSFFDQSSSVIGYEMEEAKKNKDGDQFFVMDFEKEYLATFTESDGEKVAMSMPLPMNLITDMAANEAEKQQEDEDYSIDRTGKTQMINGYRCEEFVVTSKDYVQHLWLTKDLNVDMGFTEMFSKMMKNNQQYDNPLTGEGYPMLIEMIEKKNDKKSYIRTKDVQEGNFPFQASEYSYSY